jgi:cytochrome c peroxidase
MRTLSLYWPLRLFLVAILALASAQAEAAGGRTLQLPHSPYNYRQAELPRHFAQVVERRDNTPPDNPITDHGATLGRVLFYDKTLSINGTTSCASCHQQKLAFTDGRTLSAGFDGRLVTRNSMSLINVRYYANGRFFWDERAATLEDQVIMPIENEVEMGHSLKKLISQLAADPIYPPLFRKAFGSDRVTKDCLAKALAQFVRAIVSHRSKYDQGRAAVESVHDVFPNFTPQENYGKQMFLERGKCANCHLYSEDVSEAQGRQSALFFVDRATVNGIDGDLRVADLGVGGYSGRREDVGAFKAPSLRNIELTGPYMHDGRFPTLNRVIEHYNWSVRPHPNLDPRLHEASAHGLALPEVEKVALIDFLKTLTDHELANDRRFANPFVDE